MQITDLPITDIRPYWRNPRKNDKAVDAVKQSITDYGFLQPVVIDADNVIIAGHTRYRALLELGADTIACVKADLPPDKAREYRIADNKTGEIATWDMDALIPELREMRDPAHMQSYFTFDLSRLLDQMTAVTTITPEDITKHETQMADRFQQQSTAVQGSYVELLCPHCGEEFYMDRNEINRAPAAQP